MYFLYLLPFTIREKRETSMPFPAGVMHYRMGLNVTGQKIHKVPFSTVFFHLLIEKKDKNRRSGSRNAQVEVGMSRRERGG